MEIKLKNLLRILETANKPVTAKILAEKLEISRRTVVTYISNINSIVPNLIVSSASGYSLQKNLWKSKNFFQLKDFSPQTADERFNCLILQLLLTDKKIFLVEFAESLFVSTETVKKDIAGLQKVFKNSSLKIFTSKGEIFLDGTEPDKRSLLSNSINKNLSYTRLSLKELQKIFKVLPVNEIYRALKKIIAANNFFINDSLWANLMRDVLIAVTRIKLANQLPEIACEKEIPPVVTSSAKKIESLCNVKFGNGEVSELQRLMFAYLLPKNFTTLNFADLKKFLPACTNEILEKIIAFIQRTMPFLNLTEHFLVRFSLNVHNFLRQKSGERVTINPQLEDMKNASPFVFCMAKIIVAQLAELAKKNFTEDDAAYLSVHIGLALQKQLNRNCDAKIECGLLLTPYFDYDISLKEKLLKIFGDDIKIVAESQTETDLAQLKKAQLIFSTVPLENNFSTDWVIINPLLTTKNIGEISQQILFKRLENRKKVLRRFLAEQTFFENISPEILNPDSWGIFGDIALQIKFSDEVRKLTLTVYRAINPSDWKNCRVKIFLDFETPVSCWDFALFIVDNLTEYLHEISAKKKTETFFGL